jgi:CheY-like chemotaxis protein
LQSMILCREKLVRRNNSQQRNKNYDTNNVHPTTICPVQQKYNTQAARILDMQQEVEVDVGGLSFIPTEAAVQKPLIDYGKVSVLLAEDNVINQKVLSRMLNRIGVTDVDIVNNGQQAFEQSGLRHYDIIFMDMQMPVMSGLEATEMIVKRQRTTLYNWHHPHDTVDSHSQSKDLSTITPKQQTPFIVFVTAHATHDYEKMAFASGGNGFISKPFNLSAIQELLKKVPTPQIDK